MFEHFRQPLISRRAYQHRLLGAGLLALCMIAFSLAMGMAGYHLLERQPWLDAFLSASMILSGMGPAYTGHVGSTDEQEHQDEPSEQKP